MKPTAAPTRPVDQLRAELATVLDSFEQATGRLVCVRALASPLRGIHLVPGRYGQHRSDFCDRQKDQRLSACMYNDLDDLPNVCRPDVDLFIRRCHAGAEELLIPLFRHGVLLGVIFVGQFRQTSDGPSELQQLTEDQAAQLIALGRALRSYVLDIVDRAVAFEEQHADDRALRITRYLDANLASDPSLTDLAGHLNLSPSRTSHLVSELTGQSFRELKQDRRIAAAMDLLASSSAKVAWIASQVGFDDANYFCRYFKQKTGQTPTAYRQRFTGERNV